MESPDSAAVTAHQARVSASGMSGAAGRGVVAQPTVKAERKTASKVERMINPANPKTAE